jgi:CubicO group peptidase (beta-lactamase class C family)
MRAYQGAVPGAGVAVLRGGMPIVAAAYGFADLENRVAATTATNYRLASVTKQFTAAAILLLSEAGRLSIDDRVRRWLPALPHSADETTIRHLLTHTSGLIDFEDLIPGGTTSQLHDADVLRLLAAENRGYFPAGASYRYSNSGYSLLALIVGRASGEDFASFLRHRIFLPLGMQNTVAFEAGISTVAHRAYGYSAGPVSWTRTDQSLTSATLGDGAFIPRSMTSPNGRPRCAMTGSCGRHPCISRSIRRRRPTIRPFNMDSAGASPARLYGIRGKRPDFAMSSCATGNGV